MAKTDETEKLLLAALARLVAGKPEHTDGALTQANVAKEAGVTRATFNRYPVVVAAWRDAKNPAGNKALCVEPGKYPDTVAALRKELTEARRQWLAELAAARQEIMILNTALQLRDETIANLRRAQAPEKVIALARS